jgi:hypothetical protein
VSGGGAGGGACVQCIVAPGVTWGQNGGLVAYADSMQLNPCMSYKRSRSASTPGDTGKTCTVLIPSCPNELVSNVAGLLALPDVQQAMKSHTVFGVDSRPVDGQVLRVEVGADYLEIGSPCQGAAGCPEIPASVTKLKDALDAIDAAALLIEPCMTTFGGP